MADSIFMNADKDILSSICLQCTCGTKAHVQIPHMTGKYIKSQQPLVPGREYILLIRDRSVTAEYQCFDKARGLEQFKAKNISFADLTREQADEA